LLEWHPIAKTGVDGVAIALRMQGLSTDTAPFRYGRHRLGIELFMRAQRINAKVGTQIARALRLSILQGYPGAVCEFDNRIERRDRRADINERSRADGFTNGAASGLTVSLTTCQDRIDKRQQFGAVRYLGVANGVVRHHRCQFVRVA